MGPAGARWITLRTAIMKSRPASTAKINKSIILGRARSKSFLRLSPLMRNHVCGTNAPVKRAKSISIGLVASASQPNITPTTRGTNSTNNSLNKKNSFTFKGEPAINSWCFTFSLNEGEPICSLIGAKGFKIGLSIKYFFDFWSLSSGSIKRSWINCCDSLMKKNWVTIIKIDPNANPNTIYGIIVILHLRSTQFIEGKRTNNLRKSRIG